VKLFGAKQLSMKCRATASGMQKHRYF